MKRYRVNYKLLIALGVGTVVLLPSLYGLWRFQVGRNADRLLARAEEAMTADDALEALDNMARYVALRPEEVEAYRKASKLASDVLDERDVPREAVWTAYSVLEQGVNETGDAEIRRRFVDALHKFHSWNRELVEIDELLHGGSTDQELYSMKVEALLALQDYPEMRKTAFDAIGYSDKTDTFDASTAKAPNKPMIYFRLAQVLKFREESELADRIIEQMLVANPDLAEAHVNYYRYLIAVSAGMKFEAEKEKAGLVTGGKSEEQAAEAVKDQLAAAEAKEQAALASLARAKELAPDDEDVLYVLGDRAVTVYSEALQDGMPKEEAAPLLDEAANYFNEGAEKYKENSQFIYRTAMVEAERGNFDKAIAVLDEGLKFFKLPAPDSLSLFNLKLEMLLQKRDLDGIEAAVKQLRQFNESGVKAIADFNEGRIYYANKNWAKAAQTLRNAKARLLGISDMQATASVLQGAAHEALGQNDLAADAYEWALTKNPNDQRAMQALTALNLKRGKAVDPEADSLDARVELELQKPFAEQNWAALESQIDRVVAERGLGAAHAAALKAQILLRRAELAPDGEAKDALFQRARDLIREAFAADKDDLRVRVLAIRLLRLEPGKGPAEALKLLDRMLKDPKVEDSPELRSLRADLLVDIGGADLSEKLRQVAEGMDEWTDSQKASTYYTVGARLAQIGDLKGSQELLEKTIELTPTNLPACKWLFDVSLQARDMEAVKKAQARIAEILGSENDPDYVLTEIRRRMSFYGTGEVSDAEMEEAETMLNAALKKRPRFSELWVIKGQLELGLHKDLAEALKAFDMALETGPPNANAIKLQVGILVDQGNFAEAARILKLLPPGSAARIVGRAAAEVYRGTGDMESAFRAAKEVADAAPQDAATKQWFAEFAVAGEKYDEAEQALQDAAKANPSDPNLWSKIIGLFAQTKQYEKLEGALRDAHLLLDEEYLPLLNARYYEMQGRWNAAEDIYRSAYKDRMEDPDVLQRFAEMYLNWPRALKGDPRRAAPYLNKLLKLGYEGELKPDDPYVVWARRKAAAVFAEQGSFSSMMNAEKVLSPLAELPNASPTDVRQLAAILTHRMDPDARTRAIGLWERLRKAGLLQPQEILMLGQLYADTGQLSAAQDMLEDAIAKDLDNVTLISGYAKLLIEQRDFARARRQISSLQRKGFPAGALLELQTRLAARSGDMDKARELLVSLTPNLSRPTKEQIEGLRGIGYLANDVGDHEYALRMASEYARRVPSGQLELARMTGLYGDAKQSMDMLKRLFDDEMDDVLRVAMEVYRARRPEVGDVIDDDIARFVRQAVNDDPENAQRIVLQAESLEIAEKFDESIAAYEDILKNDDIPPMARATALNNLAFLLALKAEKSRLDDALAAVDEAAEILGPISDILDTRAVVLTERGEFDKAAADMKKSVQIGPTPSKYYHLSRALLGAGDEEGAVQAWRRGVEEGLDLDKISALEHDQFAKFKEQIEAL